MKKNSSRGFNRFLIDVSKEQVFCRECGAWCRSIQLRKKTIFYCPSTACRNTGEMVGDDQDARFVRPATSLWKEYRLRGCFKALIHPGVGPQVEPDRRQFF
jgi:hypothetical protein